VADEHRNADAIALVHTGASVTGATQADPAVCLGGYRSASYAAVYTPLVNVQEDNRLTTIRIDRVFCVEAPSVAMTITAESISSLSFEGGSTIEIADGETKVLKSTGGLSVVVTRISAADLVGTLEFTATPAFNEVFGMSNVSNAKRTTGEDYYQAVGVYNKSDLTVSTTVRVVPLLVDYAVSTVGQLGAAGAGTIQGAAACFTDWPESGWCHIRIGTTTVREVVYYTSRTDNTLTVPATGRGRLGTTPAAGGNTDRLYAVPGIRIAVETPGAGGDIQTIADIYTAPSGLTWYTPLYSTTDSALLLSSIVAGAWGGLWVHREIPSAASAAVAAQNRLLFAYSYNSILYYSYVSSNYRIQDTTIRGYELYIGEDAEPDLTAAPDETSATLPFSHSITPPVSGETDFCSVVLYRNAYNLTSRNTYSRSCVVDSTGAEITLPTAPTFSVEAGVGGTVKIIGNYNPNDDTLPADTWRVYITSGVDPVPGIDTPIEIAMTADAVYGSPLFGLYYTSAQYGSNANIRVLVTTFRSDDSEESNNTTAVEIVTDTMTPEIPTQRIWHLGIVSRQAMSPPTVNETTVYNVPFNVRAICTPGQTDFYAGATLIWRIKYDSNGPANNGLWTTLAFHQVDSPIPYPGPDPENIVNVTSATTIYIIVNSRQWLAIDLTAGIMSCAGISQSGTYLVVDHDSAPFCDRTFHTLFQVWDKATWQYVTIGSLDQDGRLSLAIPVRQRTDIGDFE